MSIKAATKCNEFKLTFIQGGQRHLVKPEGAHQRVFFDLGNVPEDICPPARAAVKDYLQGLTGMIR